MSKYLVKLKPLTPFFFGGENTFGEGDVNYFAKSNYMPQQTTILGFLRYELLAQNGLIGTDPVSQKWADLIGSQSFECIDDKFTASFGAIKNISPVFIMDGNDSYLTQSFDWAYYEDDQNSKPINGCRVSAKKIDRIQIRFEEANKLAVVDSCKDYIPILEVGGKKYDPKLGLATLWVCDDGTKLKHWDFDEGYKDDGLVGNGFFVSKSQIGIHRETNKSKTQKGDFYKQIFKSFHNANTCFAFYVDIDLPIGKKLASRITTMGGERSAFEMTITKVDSQFQSFEFLFKNAFVASHPNRKNVVILTSDAYCHQNILNQCKFAITDSIPFRNITTKQISGINYAALDKTDKSKAKLFKTKELIFLLKRGSVLYSDEAQTLKENIESLTPFYNIGYNHCIAL
ncbi:MAG TPA: type III-B CRISPR module-associated Cmr3 family protein [Saprospiraceae bacterium]|nr:type III-B CRISPR module-associated Cmr3 family protein [Saprospiraceae bacterium]